MSASYQADPKAVCEYACEDADVTWRLYEVLSGQLAGSPFETLFHETEMPLDEVLAAHDMDMLSADERRAIWWDAVHGLVCWPDFPPVLPRLREKLICASFTILSFRIIIDTARRNGLSWDAVISCEAIGKYKILPESYQTAARFLQLDPSEICMVACHNFDLDILLFYIHAE